MKEWFETAAKERERLRKLAKAMGTPDEETATIHPGVVRGLDRQHKSYLARTTSNPVDLDAMLTGNGPEQAYLRPEGWTDNKYGASLKLEIRRYGNETVIGVYDCGHAPSQEGTKKLTETTTELLTSLGVKKITEGNQGIEAYLTPTETETRKTSGNAVYATINPNGQAGVELVIKDTLRIGTNKIKETIRLLTRKMKEKEAGPYKYL